MPRWISITTATLYEAKIGALVDACDSAALATGQANRAAGLITGVVNNIRRKIASNPRNRLDADETTVPEGLRDMAVVFALAKLKNVLQIALTPAEANELEEQRRELNRIADGKDTVEQPDTPIVAPVELGGSIETIVTGNSGSTREEMSGL